MNIPPKFQAWIDARKRFHLSHAQVQMARELGMNPKKLGKLANHKQESWKLPLPLFIEKIYEKRFRRPRPLRVISVEDRVKEIRLKKEEKKTASRGEPLPGIPPGQDRYGDEVPF